jgi:hypothetical protein
MPLCCHNIPVLSQRVREEDFPTQFWSNFSPLPSERGGRLEHHRLVGVWDVRGHIACALATLSIFGKADSASIEKLMAKAAPQTAPQINRSDWPTTGLLYNSLILLANLERANGFEPSTLTLARLCSTPELRPRSKLGAGYRLGRARIQ